jgi:hypothetical protein
MIFSPWPFVPLSKSRRRFSVVFCPRVSLPPVLTGADFTVFAALQAIMFNSTLILARQAR